MRKQFVMGTSRRQAAAECPWAAKIVKVEGGYMCFESAAEYESWRQQR